MTEETVTFIDSETYRGDGSSKFALTFKQIVMMHINRCVTNGSVEYRGGFYENRIGSQGQTGTQIVRTYVESKIDIFCNSIRILNTLLYKYFKKEDISTIDEIKEKVSHFTLSKKYKGVKDQDVKAQLDEEKIDLYFQLFDCLIAVAHRKNFFNEIEEEGEIL